jgi:hypothetical protein
MSYAIIVLERDKQSLEKEKERIIRTMLTDGNNVCHKPLKAIKIRLAELYEAITLLNEIQL